MIITDIFTRTGIEKEKLNVQDDSVLQLLGYDGKVADPFVAGTIKNCIAASNALAFPKSGFVVKKIKGLHKEGILDIDDISLNIHKIIAAQLKNSQFAAIFFATIGKEIELQSAREFEKSNMLEGYIYNLIGSETAELAAAYVHKQIENIALESGFKVTNRFSPGYCGWNVQEQFKLFSLFPNTFNDVILTESALMDPVKSVSGIIGIGENVKYDSYSCKFCGDNNCFYRKKYTNRIS